MGLFDKRKKSSRDDFDSPVEKIDLSVPPPSPSLAEPEAPPPTPTVTISADPPPQSVAAPPEPPMDYGIQQAIELMRGLPAENVELVVQVVKKTLESTNIQISSIIKDASRKQKDIEGRIGVLKTEISDYEQEIATRKDEIARLEADHKETTLVKERLVLAENLPSSKGPDKPTARTDTAAKADPTRPGLGTPRPSAPSPSSSPSSSIASKSPSRSTVVAKK